jgi:hypothetical protein
MTDGSGESLVPWLVRQESGAMMVAEEIASYQEPL